MYVPSLLNLVLSNRQSLRSSREQGMRRRKRRSNGDCGGLLQPTPVHSSTCWYSVQLPLRLIGQERCQIVIFPRLWPFCVFEIVLWVFGLEGGLAGRPELPLLTGSAISASVALLAGKGSIQMSSPLLHGALWSWWTEKRVLGISEIPEKQFSPGGGLSLGLQHGRNKLD